MKRFTALFLSVFFVFSVSATGQAIPQTNDTYTITTPYEYPILPGTEEWFNLEDNLAKIEACAVPEELIPQMTTDALLETYLTHPMAVNVFAFDSYNAGFEIFEDFYKLGLDELMQREDLSECLLNRYNQIEVYTGEGTATYSTEALAAAEDNAFDDLLEMQLIEVAAAQLNFNTRSSANAALENALYEKYLAKTENQEFYGPTATCYYKTLAENNNAQTYDHYSYTQTPNGTEVRLLYVEQEWTGLEALNAKHQALYPAAVQIGDPTIFYNCHSYAWYSQLPNNRYQLVDPRPYMYDGSYYKVPTSQVQARVYYDFPIVEGDDIDRGGEHSAIVVRKGASTIYVRSKWSSLGLYEHLISDCPYYYGYGTLTYWAR